MRAAPQHAAAGVLSRHLPELDGQAAKAAAQPSSQPPPAVSSLSTVVPTAGAAPQNGFAEVTSPGGKCAEEVSLAEVPPERAVWL